MDTVKEVDFWHLDFNDMRLRHNEGIYPPKITFMVCSGTAQIASAKFEVRGMESEEVYQINISEVFGQGELLPNMKQHNGIVEI